MLDIKVVRQDPERIAAELMKKKHRFPVEEFLRLDAERKTADVSSQDLLAERKKASKQIGSLIAGGMSVDDAKAEVNATLERLSSELDAAVDDLSAAMAAAPGHRNAKAYLEIALLRRGGMRRDAGDDARAAEDYMRAAELGGPKRAEVATALAALPAPKRHRGGSAS